MPAYVIDLVDVHDRKGYEEYIAKAPATVAAYGGKYLARAPSPEVLEGAPPGRGVILEFPTLEQGRQWHASAEYRETGGIRRRCARSTLLAVPGT